MIQGRSVLAVIPARGGSRGLPRKNLAPFRGRPLIAWTIAAARAARFVDRVVLSSDDPEIIATAQALGCEAPFVRAPALSDDRAASVDVLIDAVERLGGSDIAVLLQPTSPLRTAADIDGALRAMVEADAESCVSVCEAAVHPWLVYGRDDAGRLSPLAPTPRPVPRRQDFPAAYQLNGAVYAVSVPALVRDRTLLTPGRTAAFVMPADRSADIDTQADLDAAQAVRD